MPHIAFSRDSCESDWPLREIIKPEDSFDAFDTEDSLPGLFSYPVISDNGIRPSIKLEDLKFQPFGPDERKFDLASVEFFSLNSNWILNEQCNIPITSFLIGKSSGRRGVQLLDSQRDQIWSKHKRILITTDKSCDTPGHIILLLAEESPVELWHILGAIQSMLFEDETEMDTNLVIDVYENQIPVNNFCLDRPTEQLQPQWNYIIPKGLAWLGSIISDQWDIGSPDWADISKALLSRCGSEREIDIDNPIHISKKGFGARPLSKAVNDTIPFSSIIDTSDVSSSGMPILNQIIFSTANRHNHIRDKDGTALLREKLGKTYSWASKSIQWNDVFMVEEWNRLNSILYQSFSRTGQIMLFSPTLQATHSLLHLFRQMHLDAFTFTMTQKLSTDGLNIEHAGDLLTFATRCVNEYFSKTLEQRKYIQSWETFLKGFISTEGWFVSFYKPEISICQNLISSSYNADKNFEDFSLRYRKHCASNTDPYDRFVHDLPFVTNNDAYKNFVKTNPKTAVESKDQLLTLLPLVVKWLKVELFKTGANFITKAQSIQNIIKWRENMVTTEPLINMEAKFYEGMISKVDKHWTLLQHMLPQQVLFLLEELPSFHQRMSQDNWIDRKHLPIELILAPVESTKHTLRHLMEPVWKKLEDAFDRRDMIGGKKEANERFFDLRRLINEQSFKEWKGMMKEWPKTESKGIMKSLHRMIVDPSDRDEFESILSDHASTFKRWINQLEDFTFPSLHSPIDPSIQTLQQLDDRWRVTDEQRRENNRLNLLWDIIRRNLLRKEQVDIDLSNPLLVDSGQDDSLTSTDSETESTSSFEYWGPIEKTKRAEERIDAGLTFDQTEKILKIDKNTDMMNMSFIQKHSDMILSSSGRDKADPMFLRILEESMACPWISIHSMTRDKVYSILTPPEGLRLKALFDLYATRELSAQETIMPGRNRSQPVFYSGAPSEWMNVSKDTYQMSLKPINRKYIVLEAQVDQSENKDWKGRKVRFFPVLLHDWNPMDYELRNGEKGMDVPGGATLFYNPLTFKGGKFDWERYTTESLLMRMLYSRPSCIQNDLKAVLEMLYQRDILPIFVFKSDKDFRVVELTMKWGEELQPNKMASPLLGFIAPRLEEHQLNMMKDRMSPNSVAQISRGFVSNNLSEVRARAKTALDAAGSRYITAFCRREGTFHFALTPSFNNMDMLVKGPALDSILRRSKTTWLSSSNSTLSHALARAEVTPATLANISPEHMAEIENPLNLRPLSLTYHDQTRVTERVIGTSPLKPPANEMDRMKRWKQMILSQARTVKPHTLSCSVTSHEDWRNLKFHQPQPTIIGQFSPDGRLRPKPVYVAQDWHELSFTQSWAKPLLEGPAGVYATFDEDSHSGFGHAMMTLMTMWLESATTNQIRTSLTPSLYRLFGREPPIKEKAIPINVVQMTERTHNNQKVIAQMAASPSHNENNYFMNDADRLYIINYRYIIGPAGRGADSTDQNSLE